MARRNNYAGMNGTFYLNNSGSRWVNFKDGQKPKIYVYCHTDKQYHKRTALFFESFGNFVLTYFSWHGGRCSGFADETHDGLPLVYIA